MATKKLADPIYELGPLLPGEALERLKGLLSDPGADHSPGEMARFGAAFSQIGETLTKEARDGMAARLVGGVGASGRSVDGAVMFEWRPSREYSAVDTKSVKSTFPPAEYPELYTVRHVRDTVMITLLDQN